MRNKKKKKKNYRVDSGLSVCCFACFLRKHIDDGGKLR